MSRRMRDDVRGSFIASVGWLFADLLLVLSIIFLAANTFSFPKPPPTPTPSATKVTVKIDPTPTPNQRVMELNYCRLKLNDPDRITFSNNFSYAKGVLEPQINSLKFLQGRYVGIAIAYGGVTDENSGNDRGMAVNVAAMTYKVLQDLAQHGPIFKTASYYDPLFTSVEVNDGNIVIDLYLLVRPDGPAETCNPNNHQPL